MDQSHFEDCRWVRYSDHIHVRNFISVAQTDPVVTNTNSSFQHSWSRRRSSSDISPARRLSKDSNPDGQAIGACMIRKVWKTAVQIVTDEK